MPQAPKLPPLDEEAFDGYKEEAPIPRDIPIPKTCNHKDVHIISSTEIKCGCGVGWSGHDILKLYNILKGQ